MTAILWMRLQPLRSCATLTENGFCSGNYGPAELATTPSPGGILSPGSSSGPPLAHSLDDYFGRAARDRHTGGFLPRLWSGCELDLADDGMAGPGFHSRIPACL